MGFVINDNELATLGGLPHILNAEENSLVTAELFSIAKTRSSKILYR
jgi:hypothetical protein